MFMASLPQPNSAHLSRHGRACPGHPRLAASQEKDVDARHKAGHDGAEAIAGLIGLPLSREAAAIQGENAATFG
jgi:hypothetical protein